MTPEEYAQLKSVFARAIEQPPEKQAAFAKAQCGEKPDLAAEVLALLEHHQKGTILKSLTLPASREVTQVVATDEDEPFLVQSEVWNDNRQIVRRRLIVVALTMAAFVGLSLVRLPLTHQYPAWGYGARVACLLITILCAVALHYRKEVTVFQLRLAEWVIMANIGLLAVVVYLRLLVRAAEVEDAATLISVNNWNYFAWTMIIMVYGVFMPNRWQRAAAVLLPVALIPTLVVWVAGRIEPDVPTMLAEDEFGRPFPTPFAAACIAIYAAHVIHGARVTAFQARKLAQYHVRRLIGEGGMGQVFEAEHMLLKRPTAIKVIQPEHCVDDSALERFEREVRATAKLTHPHTIEVYDFGQTMDGIFFFAMEFLPGMNLRDLVLAAGPLPASRATHFLCEACEALEEAHSIGLIHRDIKPANIFASQRGGIWDFTKLLDFGLVREFQTAPNLTRNSMAIAGTPSYMSPEQITSPLSVDPRTDIYALGAVAYYLLTGRAPFVFDSPLDIISAHIHRLPEPPTVHRPELPSDVEAVVMKCLQKNPEDRFQSAAQMQRQLLACSCHGLWTSEKADQWWGERQQRTAKPASAAPSPSTSSPTVRIEQADGDAAS